MRILIACGGSAGHIFPGFALTEQLRSDNQDCRITVVISTHPRDRQYLKAIANVGDFDVVTMPACGLPYRLSLRYVPFITRSVLALLKSFYIMFRYRPQVVVGFGGYVSFAPLVAARLFGIPTLIHEQNYLPGRANRLLAQISNRVAVSFEESIKLFRLGEKQNKIATTGFPLRNLVLEQARGKADAVRKNNYPEASPRLCLFVLGGSQGAHNINELVLDCLSRMDKTILAQIRIIHLSGKKDFSYVQRSYAALDVPVQVFDFLNNVASAYRDADLLIGRAGAGTIFEAASFALPCLLIPHSGGTKHQQENAAYLKRLGAALVLDENSASAEDLAKALLELITNQRLRQELSSKVSLLGNFRAQHNLEQQLNDLYNLHYVYR